MVQCHDRTPFVDYQCDVCSFIMHVHRSQLPADLSDTTFLTSCKGCGCLLTLSLPDKFIGDKQDTPDDPEAYYNERAEKMP